MKKSKKAIFGMLVAMIMSPGMMGGINGKNHNSNLQQVSATAGYFAIQTEGWVSASLGVAAVGTGYAAKEMIKVGIAAFAVTTANPCDWGWWHTTAGLGL